MSKNSHIDRLRAASLKYKPDRIKFLFVAEAPPLNPDRYFYFENISKGDTFYLETMNALYSCNRFDSKYLRENKASFLNRFKQDGFYLIDACECPMENNKRSFKERKIRECLPDLRNRISQLIFDETKIILILVTVYRVCYVDLKSNGVSVINECPIPFPGLGHQKKFRKLLRELLIKYKYECCGETSSPPTNRA